VEIGQIRLMSVKINRLSARQVETLPPGFHADGGGLYLRVRSSGSRAWVFRYTQRGITSERGLGATHSRSLADARKVAAAMRVLLADGADPADVLRPTDERSGPKETFASCAEALIVSKQPGWRNAKHIQQWRNTLRDYAFPVIGKLHPADVTLSHVKAILEPIWATKTETATRVRQRIEAVLDWAYVHELRTGENPARWKGVLDKVFPPPNKVRAVKHHPACPYEEVPQLMEALAKEQNIPSLCLRLLILTGVRSGEARGAVWDEVDLAARMWTLPAERTKMQRPHRVPLSKGALRILHAVPHFVGQDFIFPGDQGGQMTDVALSKELHKLMTGVTVHGFRSSFRQWSEEQTSFPKAVCELALSHVNKDRVEAAYQRSDLFERRRELMEAWDQFLAAKGHLRLVTTLTPSD
jgi:integrase